MFQLLREDEFIWPTYKQVERWYQEHIDEASEIIQSSYLIEKNLLGKKIRKVDMTRGYMKEDIGYSIILLRRIMSLSVVGHLNIFMLHFIEMIKKVEVPLDWASTLSENLCEKLVVAKNNRKFHMTSYLVYLLPTRVIDYPRLYKKGSM